jgi:hypothetical protein
VGPPILSCFGLCGDDTYRAGLLLNESEDVKEICQSMICDRPSAALAILELRIFNPKRRHDFRLADWVVLEQNDVAPRALDRIRSDILTLKLHPELQSELVGCKNIDALLHKIGAHVRDGLDANSLVNLVQLVSVLHSAELLDEDNTQAALALLTALETDTRYDDFPYGHWQSDEEEPQKRVCDEARRVTAKLRRKYPR